MKRCLGLYIGVIWSCNMIVWLWSKHHKGKHCLMYMYMPINVCSLPTSSLHLSHFVRIVFIQGNLQYNFCLQRHFYKPKVYFIHLLDVSLQWYHLGWNKLFHNLKKIQNTTLLSYSHLIGASKDLATVTMTLVPNTQKMS